jgi:hypothetical protein
VERKSNPRPQPDGREPESPERAALEALVEAVVGAAYEVSNVLGAGFLEKLYERALIEELRLRGIPSAAQAIFPVAYKGSISVRTLPIWLWTAACSSKSSAPIN